MNIHSLLYICIMTKKDAILNAALKLVNKEGFYHLNMKNLSIEAGVAVGTAYLYFSSKEALINELYIRIVNDFKIAVLKGYDTTRADKDNFMEMVGNAVDFYVSNPDCFSFIEQYSYSPFLFKETHEENFLILEPLYKIIKLAKKRKTIKELSGPLCLALAYGPVVTMVRLHLAGKADLSKRNQRVGLVECCWNNIKAD